MGVALKNEVITILTYEQIANFLQIMLYAFDEYIVFAFVVMVTFSIALGVRNLLTWGY